MRCCTSDLRPPGNKFIGHEFFLYTLALLTKGEQFDAATALFEQMYFSPRNAERGLQPMVSFAALRSHAKALVIRNERLDMRRLSLRADLLEQRSKSSGVEFRYLMQADFLSFLRADFTKGSEYGGWWPETLLYANRQYGAFELFARAVSSRYLQRLLPVLGVPNIATLQAKFASFGEASRALPRWDYEQLSPSSLAGADKLGSMP